MEHRYRDSLSSSWTPLLDGCEGDLFPRKIDQLESFKTSDVGNGESDGLSLWRRSFME